MTEPDETQPTRETTIPVDDSADDLLRPTPGPVYPPDPPDLDINE